MTYILSRIFEDYACNTLVPVLALIEYVPIIGLIELSVSQIQLNSLPGA